MNVRFNADEIFRLAERLEQNASTYYRTAADHPNVDDAARRMFLDLSSWEEQHEQIFSSLRKNLGEQASEELTYDPYEEAPQYLDRFADSSIFKTSEPPLNELGDNPGQLDILKLALQRENDTIEFYTEMQELVPPQAGHERIDAIVQEEQKHVRIISERIDSISDAPGNTS